MNVSYVYAGLFYKYTSDCSQTVEKYLLKAEKNPPRKIHLHLDILDEYLSVPVTSLSK